LTGDAGKEKTGLDGRFFCVWGLGACGDCFESPVSIFRQMKVCYRTSLNISFFMLSEINVFAQDRASATVFMAPVVINRSMNDPSPFFLSSTFLRYYIRLHGAVHHVEF
jgi:hypothetical protein